MTGSLTARSSLAGSEKNLYNLSDLFETVTVHRLEETFVLEWTKRQNHIFQKSVEATLRFWALSAHMDCDYT